MHSLKSKAQHPLASLSPFVEVNPPHPPHPRRTRKHLHHTAAVGSRVGPCHTSTHRAWILLLEKIWPLLMVGSLLMNLRFLYCIPWCPSPLGRTLMQSWRDLGGVWPPALPNLLCSTRHTFAISGVGKPYLKLSARHPESQFYASCNETTSQPCYHVTLKSFPFDKLTDMSSASWRSTPGLDIRMSSDFTQETGISWHLWNLIKPLIDLWWTLCFIYPTISRQHLTP